MTATGVKGFGLFAAFCCGKMCVCVVVFGLAAPNFFPKFGKSERMLCSAA